MPKLISAANTAALKLMFVTIIIPNLWYDLLSCNGERNMRFLLFCAVVLPLIMCTSIGKWPINFVALIALLLILVWRVTYFIAMEHCKWVQNMIRLRYKI